MKIIQIEGHKTVVYKQTVYYGPLTWRLVLKERTLELRLENVTKQELASAERQGIVRINGYVRFSGFAGLSPSVWHQLNFPPTRRMGYGGGDACVTLADQTSFSARYAFFALTPEERALVAEEERRDIAEAENWEPPPTVPAKSTASQAAIPKADASAIEHSKLDATLTKVAHVAQQLDASAAKLTLAGDHVETKTARAAEYAQQVRVSFNAMMSDVAEDQAKVEAIMKEWRLKENPRQTRSALTHHRVPKRIIEFIFEHLLAGKPVPKAPTAAGIFKKKYPKEAGFDRRTVDRHFTTAASLLQAAGWPCALLPKTVGIQQTANVAKEASSEPDPPDPSPASETGKPDPVAQDSKPTIEILQRQETGVEAED